MGNALSFVVFSRAALKHTAPAFYFRVMVVADTLAVNVGLWPDWLLNAFGIHIYPMTDISCRIQFYLRYPLADCAVWVLVIITIERMVNVRWPHHVHTIFTRRRTRSSVVIMVFFINIINIPSLWTATRNDGDTSDMLSHYCKAANMVIAYDIWPLVYLTIYCFFAIRHHRNLYHCHYQNHSPTTKHTVPTWNCKQSQRKQNENNDSNTSYNHVCLSIAHIPLCHLRNQSGRITGIYILGSASVLRCCSISTLCQQLHKFLLVLCQWKSFRDESLYVLRVRERRLSRYSFTNTGASNAVEEGNIRSAGKESIACPVESPVLLELNVLSYQRQNSKVIRSRIIIADILLELKVLSYHRQNF